jgi:phospholipid/cholesterol/gamma-HCH transport system permease protein
MLAIRLVGRASAGGFRAVGRFVLFTKSVIREFFPIPLNLLFIQMEFIGNKSFGIITLAALMIGAVFGLQFGEIFRVFKSESMIGAAASYSLSKELAPVVSAFLVTGRAGSSMAAEIATMKVNDQIDSLKVLGVSPFNYLIAPRILATFLMLPLLSAVFLFVGVVSSYVIGVVIFNVDAGVYIANIQWISEPKHIFEGLVKSAIFGLILSLIGCYKGLEAGRGAKGVGTATTQSVVMALVSILIVDFLLSFLYSEF